jgi:hypothetical protein
MVLHATRWITPNHTERCWGRAAGRAHGAAGAAGDGAVCAGGGRAVRAGVHVHALPRAQPALLHQPRRQRRRLHVPPWPHPLPSRSVRLHIIMCSPDRVLCQSRLSDCNNHVQPWPRPLPSRVSDCTSSVLCLCTSTSTCCCAPCRLTPKGRCRLARTLSVSWRQGPGTTCSRVRAQAGCCLNASGSPWRQAGAHHGGRARAGSAYALLVLAALGITGSWGPLTSWPALLLCGRAKAPGFGFFNAFASWCALACRGSAPCMQHMHRCHGTKVAARQTISR